MFERNGMLRLGAILPAIAACLVLAGCGSSGNSVGLLRQTFCGRHTVNSGKVTVALSIQPSGSRTITGPISLTFGGPFESQGTGKLPKSDFTVTLAGLGQSASLGLISTGTNGYVTFEGSAYQIPQSSFHSLESGFSHFASPPGCGSASSSLSKLNIHPLRWLSSPHVVGTETIGGVSTIHVSSGVDVSALLADLSSLLKRGASLGASGASALSNGLSPSTVNLIAQAVQNPTVDVWTGKADKTLRRIQVHLTLPVSGQISTMLGGLSSAGITLTLSYAGLNQPQTITPPSSVQPFSQFQTKIQAFIAGLRGALSSVVGSGSLGGSSVPGASGGNYNKYSQCIQGANGDVAKMQKCASLLSNG